MRAINWTEVAESNGGTMLDPGAYVCRIVDVHDVPDKEYLWIVYDVAEGPKAGIYAGMGRDDEWKHRFTRSYKETAEGMFKAFFTRIEESNRGFKWGGTDEREFIGKEVGLVFGEEYYTGSDGSDKKRTVVSRVIASQDVRNGNYKVPEPNDRREDKSFPFGQQKSGGAYSATGAKVDDYSDIPFM